MTAFAGIVWLDGGPADPRQVESLAGATLGPAGEAVGVWAEGPAALAAAQAVPVPGRQPLRDETSGCVLVFDGRLDNRDELLASLPERRPAAADPDAELVLAAYLAWEEEAPTRLLGDFAFAVWDPRHRRLLLARDPAGIRPVFISRLTRGVVFASTLEQLFRHPDVAGEVDDDAAVAYLYAHRLQLRRSFFRDAEPLFGGELATVDERGVRRRRYWRWTSEPPPFRLATGTEREEFGALFEDAVRRRLESPAPVGIMLSGGLDSGAIAAVAGHLRAADAPGEIHTYSARFRQFPSADESEFAEAVVQRYGFPHTWLDGDECWALSHLEAWLPAFTEPYFDPYPVLFRGLELASGDGVRTVLTGFGGDSVLIGTPDYLGWWLLRGRWRELHTQLRALARVRRRGYAAQLVGRAVFPLLPARTRETLERRRKDLEQSDPWMPPEVRKRIASERRPVAFGGPTGWWRGLHHDLASTSDSPQQAYFDRTGRLFGADVRMPMLDVRLMEFALRTPPDAFYVDARSRAVQRAALADVLPPSVRDRETKSSLIPLMAYGIRERRRSFVAALLRDSELERRGYVLPGTWTAAMERYLAHGGRIPSWFALTLELWLRHREGRLPDPDIGNARPPL